MRIVIGLVGILALLLGGLWLVQGLGLVHIKPIACVGACETIEGSSATWAIIGFVVAAAGAWGVRYGFFRRRV
jgi:hypothetical protein